MFPVVAPLLLPPIIIMDPAQSIKAVRGKSERNAERPGGCVAVWEHQMMDLICCPSHHLPNYLTITSSASISIIWQQLHNIALFLASMETTLVGRAGVWHCGSCNIFSACHWDIQSWTRKQNKTEMSSFLPHPLLSNLSLLYYAICSVISVQKF